ncbi:MAG: hypothetical protein GKR91_00200 [Pseudomonadales bacterium]|nr:hypothetical protein [Pseudomonadales bacterium]
MSKKSKKQAERGTWALCITAGLIIGIGLGAILDNLLLTVLIGAALGAAAGYYFTHQRKSKALHKPSKKH